jgi:uncharacterized UBP type Zn finger protein
LAAGSPKKLSQIKFWSKCFPIGVGLPDTGNRGFAISVLFALRVCPCFRQFSVYHCEFCRRVGCTLCKLYRFFADTEQITPPHFPLDLIVFDRSYHPGAIGDSAEFFLSLLNVLQREELGTRAFGSIDEYTSAIGQLFRIQCDLRIICQKCQRSRVSKSEYWTLTDFATLRLMGMNDLSNVGERYSLKKWFTSLADDNGRTIIR